MVRGAEGAADGIVREIGQRLPDKSSRIIHLGVQPRDQLLSRLVEMGYVRLYGVSERRSVYDFPHYTSVRYLFARRAELHFPSAFFDCCIAPGVMSELELECISNSLKRGGLAFVGPGLDQSTIGRVFSPAGEKIGRIGIHEKMAGEGDHSDLDALRDGVSILSYSVGEGGVGEYARLALERLTSRGIGAEIVGEPGEASRRTVMVEYANGLARGAALLGDVERLSAQGKRVLVEVHDTLERFGLEERLKLQKLCVLTYRANEAAERDGIKQYLLLPHLSYANIERSRFREIRDLVLGSFGFASRYKRTGLLIRTAKRLGLPLNLLVSLNEEVGREKSLRALEELEQEFGSPLRGEGEYRRDDIRVRVGFFDPREIAREMDACSHIVFAHGSSNYQHSGVMTMAKRFSRPIVATDSFQARQAQVLRVRSFLRPAAIRYSARSFAAGLRSGRFEAAKTVSEVKGIISKESISRGYLLRHSSDLSRDEDGFDYLEAILRQMAGPAS